MAYILPIASGKGGVGKTLFGANLGIALAQAGKTTLLVDLDLGGSNLHTCLGIKNTHRGIGNYIHKKAQSLEDLIIETEVPRLFFIPGDALFPGTANLPYFKKIKIIREINNLVADFVILDLGGGTTYNTLDFFLTASGGIIVTTPETTAILNAYSFLKAATFRLLYRSFKPKSWERKYLDNFMNTKIEGSGSNYEHLIQGAREHSEEAAETIQNQIRLFVPRIVLNMGRTAQDLGLGAKLRQITRKYLTIEIEYIGFLKWDANTSKSVIQRKPFALLYPNAPFFQGINRIASKIIATPTPEIPVLYEANEDLKDLHYDFMDTNA